MHIYIYICIYIYIYIERERERERERSIRALGGTRAGPSSGRSRGAVTSSTIIVVVSCNNDCYLY